MEKPLTHNEPEWFKANRKKYQGFVNSQVTDHRKEIAFTVFSKKQHRAIVELSTSGSYLGASNKIDYVFVDFDENIFRHLCVGFSGFDESVNYYEFMAGEVDANFIRLPSTKNETFLGRHVDVILDGNLNNAPNLKNVDGLDADKPSHAVLIGDMLYFEHNGVRYLVDGDYNVVGRLPFRPDLRNIAYLNEDSRQIILRKDILGNCVLYDLEEKRIIMDDIKRIGHGKRTDFETSANEIYVYDEMDGRFIFHSARPEFFVDTYMEFIECKDDCALYKYWSCTETVRVCRDIQNNSKMYLIRGNEVLNRQCPFTAVEYLENGCYRCIVGDIDDIYDSKSDEFIYGTLNISGSNERLWFE